MNRLSRFQVHSLFWLVLMLAPVFCLYPQAGSAADATPISAAPNGPTPTVALGVGDAITVTVFGQADMDGAVTVADDGTIRLPLIGAVQIAGLSTAQTSQKIEQALKTAAFWSIPTSL